MKFLNKLLFIHSDQLSFFDNELTTHNCVIHSGGRTKNDRGNRVIHASVSDTVEVDGEEIRAFASFEGADVITPDNCCAAAIVSQLARLSLPSFCSATTRITGPSLPREAA